MQPNWAGFPSFAVPPGSWRTRTTLAAADGAPEGMYEQVQQAVVSAMLKSPLANWEKEEPQRGAALCLPSSMARIWGAGGGFGRLRQRDDAGPGSPSRPVLR